MPRLIDADKLRKDVLDLPNCYNGFSDTYDKAMILDLVDEQPTVDAVRHGRWIKNEYRSGWHCSCCGKDDLYAYAYTQNNERELQDFYCPNCGAKMDEVIKDAD